ncbi:MAG: hypothetical protein JO102_04550 [Elusimicrobia bacterium]|nr:hypothetical protein [Elusimicrobiota bacterium]
MNLVAWLTFLGSAVLEVGGDAAVRKGIRGGGLLFIVGGFVGLGCYGLLVNTVRWDFSRLLGVYVAVFACVSVLFGKFVFGEAIPAMRWLGLAVILAGSVLVQTSGQG